MDIYSYNMKCILKESHWNIDWDSLNLLEKIDVAHMVSEQENDGPVDEILNHLMEKEVAKAWLNSFSHE